MAAFEIDFLQIAANELNLTVHEKFFDDKRKKNKMYFLTKDGISVSPILNYENLNHFMLGWRRAIKHN